MIPKIIHYCWFGNQPKPQQVLACMATWKQFCPDYQLIAWTEENFDVASHPYTKEAYSAKMYSFVSDYCRLYALRRFGGIYLDVDVRLVKPFDAFLHDHSFIGKEAPFMVGTAVIGAEKGCKWIDGFMATYDKRHFISKTGRTLKQTNVAALTQYLNRAYPIYEDELEIYDVDVFCAKIYERDGMLCQTEHTVAVHEFLGSWKQKRFSWVDRIHNILYRIIC